MSENSLAYHLSGIPSFFKILR